MVNTKRKNRGRKAISPVIATVILVAVTIVTAISASFWMGGISQSYMKNELLELSYYVVPDGAGGWDVTFDLKNVGPSSISFTGFTVNDKRIEDYTPTINATGFDPLSSGASATGLIEITVDHFSSGTTVEICILTASGMEYPILVGLS